MGRDQRYVRISTVCALNSSGTASARARTSIKSKWESTIAALLQGNDITIAISYCAAKHAVKRGAVFLNCP